jgi:T5SS/PEP-CTERM-associated repeat protein
VLRLCSAAAAALALIGMAAPSQAADRYWRYIGGCGSADWLGMPAGTVNVQSAVNCWAASKDGATGQSLPSLADDVYLLHDHASLDLGIPLSMAGRTPFVAYANNLTVSGTGGRYAELRISDNRLVTNSIRLGFVDDPVKPLRYGQSLIKQSGGSVETTNLSLGNPFLSSGGSSPSASSARYELSGGSFRASDVVFLWGPMPVDLVQTGGNFTATSLWVQSAGSYRQTGGFASVAGVHVGDDFFEIKGGLLEVAGTATTRAQDLHIRWAGVMRLYEDANVSVRRFSQELAYGSDGIDGLQFFGGTLEILESASFGRLGLNEGTKAPGSLQFGAGFEPGQPTLRLAPGAQMDVGRFVVGNAGKAAVEVLAGATLKSGDSAIGTGALLMGAFGIPKFVPGDGRVLVAGASATWAVDGALAIGQAGRGELRIAQGGVVTSKAGTMGHTDQPDRAPGRNLVHIDGNGSLWSIAGDLSIGGGQTAAGNASDLVVQDGGQLQVGGTLKIWDQGTVKVAGDLSIGGGQTAASNASALVVRGGGQLRVGGTLEVRDKGTVQVGGFFMAGLLDNRGTLTGGGTVLADVVNRGRLAPQGYLVVSGSFEQSTGGVLEFELQDELTFEQFAVEGSALLGGRLALSCPAGCRYEAGQSLQLLFAAGGVSGTFEEVSFGGLNPGAFALVYGSDEVRLNVLGSVMASAAGGSSLAPVPEPSTYAMLLLGLGGLGVVARRRAPRQGMAPVA